MILAKLQEIEFRVQDLMSHLKANQIQEATLFDNVEEKTETSASEEEKPRISRQRITDGTMTARMISFRLTKELGRNITQESVVQVGKQIKANPTYSARQHVSRYSPEAVKMIMSLYRSFNRL